MSKYTVFLTDTENVHGTVLQPSVYTVQPTCSSTNYWILAKIEDHAYWFLPRSANSKRGYTEDDTYPEFPYRVRLSCNNIKIRNCRAKMYLYLKSIDENSNNFFKNENFKLGPMEQATEDHFLNCADKNAYKNAFRAYTKTKYKLNRAQLEPLKNLDLRDKICRECELDEETVEEIFTKREMCTIVNSSYEFEKKLRVKITVKIVNNQFLETTLEKIQRNCSFSRYK